MYVIDLKTEVKPLLGRPKREDKTSRVNFKINSAARKLLKNQATSNNRSESAQIEQLVIEAEALKILLKENTELNAAILPRFNELVQNLTLEIKSTETDD